MFCAWEGDHARVFCAASKAQRCMIHMYVWMCTPCAWQGDHASVFRAIAIAV